MNTRFISSEAGGGFTVAYMALYKQKTKARSKTAGTSKPFSYKGL